MAQELDADVKFDDSRVRCNADRGRGLTTTIFRSINAGYRFQSLSAVDGGFLNVEIPDGIDSVEAYELLTMVMIWA